jgi:agmatinase
MTSGDLLWACRHLAAELDVVGADVVEVCPSAIGPADITALVGSRIVHEMLTGIAVRRRSRAGSPHAERGYAVEVR